MNTSLRPSEVFRMSNIVVARKHSRILPTVTLTIKRGQATEGVMFLSFQLNTVQFRTLERRSVQCSTEQ
jgi:hypothetical protein